VLPQLKRRVSALCLPCVVSATLVQAPQASYSLPHPRMTVVESSAPLTVDPQAASQ